MEVGYGGIPVNLSESVPGLAATKRLEWKVAPA